MRILYVFIIIPLLLSCSQQDSTYTVETIDGVRHVHNRAPLQGDKPKIALEFIQKIGGLDTADENYMFFDPRDVATDNNGNIYVLDNGNHRIQKFDSDWTFIRTIGRRGQGPGEFQSCNELETDKNNNLYVCDRRNKRITVFDPDGKYVTTRLSGENINSFCLLSSDRIAIDTFLAEAVNTSSNEELERLFENGIDMVTVYNADDTELFKLGTPRPYDEYMIFLPGNLFQHSSDSKNNILMLFALQNRIEKYSSDGKLLFIADRSLPYPETTRYKTAITMQEGQNIEIQVFNRFIMDTAIDGNDRIWVQTYRKQPEPEERRFEDLPNDLFTLEVFDEDGILLNRLPFPAIPTARLKHIYRNRLFIIEDFSEMAIYEYRIVEPDT